MSLARLRRLAPGLALALSLLAVSCFEGEPTAPAPPADPRIPDFSLTDVNATSPTAGAAVSPRDYLSKVSAWYFGHAT